MDLPAVFAWVHVHDGPKQRLKPISFLQAVNLSFWARLDFRRFLESGLCSSFNRLKKKKRLSSSLVDDLTTSGEICVRMWNLRIQNPKNTQ